MSDQEILEKLGLQNASDEIKQQAIQDIVETVDMRVMGVVGEMISEDQMRQLEEMEQNGSSKEDMFGWLAATGVNTGDIYEAMKADYVAELVKDIAEFEL